VKWAVVAFPGTNCDEDTRYVLADLFAQNVRVVWHQESDLGGADAVVLPGGFAHGDYLRCGAIARFSPIMDAVLEHVARGRPVLGICNGMQVLMEAGLLPGALLRNESLEFRCRWVHVRIDAVDRRFLGGAPIGSVWRLPISHGEGRYHCDPGELASLAEHEQILLRYCAQDGSESRDANPNGSIDAVAGLRNREGTVFGLMPHPERACEAVTGGTDGRYILQSMIEALNA
jgi:phosphoribosylformylglycinamidine synthase I